MSSTRQPPAIIGVMGIHGSGKSTFSKLLSKDETILIGSDLESVTTRSRRSQCFQVGDRQVSLVDTFGIDGHRDGDEDRAIRQMTSVIKNAEKDGFKREGIIWIHKIDGASPRMIRPNTLRSLANVCGTRTYPPDLRKVVIVTTDSKALPEDVVSKEEARLRAEGFKELLDAGARMEHHNGTIEDGEKIVFRLLQQGQ
ncbi:hypothetical protein OBBRIDRAFT_640551 [Obba rivulosa]|uniref:G domain-containing protein n=1 Tax=Obba rivulosa TaxID=1052685 RepID=A0A8E2AX95_9APHY|nr:hypothetical protein OBBRIDRAFT_640551 [Obba rivulosa]